MMRDCSDSIYSCSCEREVPPPPTVGGGMVGIVNVKKEKMGGGETVPFQTYFPPPPIFSPSIPRCDAPFRQ